MIVNAGKIFSSSTSSSEGNEIVSFRVLIDVSPPSPYLTVCRSVLFVWRMKSSSINRFPSREKKQASFTFTQLGMTNPNHLLQLSNAMWVDIYQLLRTD